MRLALMALAFVFCAGSAYALVLRSEMPQQQIGKAVPAPVGRPIFGCEPATFTMTRDDKGAHLSGTLETPTPGFTYTIDNIKTDGGAVTATLNVTAPDGMAMQVISKMDVDEDFPSDTPVTAINLDIKKNYTWGTDNISCKMVGMTQ